LKDSYVKFLALALVLAGGVIFYQKSTRLGLPLLPADQTEVWTVEARIAFEAKRGPIKVRFYVPLNPPGWSILDEHYVSSNYGLATEDDGVNREVHWAIRRAKGQQVLYYRAELATESVPEGARAKPKPAYPAVPDYPEPERSAVNAVLETVRSKSADIASFTRQLLLQMNDPDPDENVQVLIQEADGPIERARKAVSILAGARIPARLVYVLKLRDGLRHGALDPWLEVHNEQEWLAFDPQTGGRGFPAHAVLWRVGDDPLVTVDGGRPAQVEFSVATSVRDPLAVAEQRARQTASRLMEFSLLSLPVQTQNVYRILLLVPLGAFLVVVMRNLIGVETFGTFMPILIALAFRETELVWGIVLFTLVVSLGLLLRFYLETLKLLLVPRLAAVLILVILLMAAISVLSHRLGLERGLSIALFPMVIMTMTIERMSVVWEENGPLEALKQGIGSLVVASLGYLVMSSRALGHLIFVFPELLLIVLALTLLMGRYSGYRLTELWRFRNALKLESRP
jgi:hypothetical protein